MLLSSKKGHVLEQCVPLRRIYYEKLNHERCSFRKIHRSVEDNCLVHFEPLSSRCGVDVHLQGASHSRSWFPPRGAVSLSVSPGLSARLVSEVQWSSGLRLDGGQGLGWVSKSSPLLSLDSGILFSFSTLRESFDVHVMISSKVNLFSPFSFEVEGLYEIIWSHSLFIILKYAHSSWGKSCELSRYFEIPYCSSSRHTYRF